MSGEPPGDGTDAEHAPSPTDATDTNTDGAGEDTADVDDTDPGPGRPGDVTEPREPDDAATGVAAAGRRLHPLTVPYRAVVRVFRPSTLIVLATALGSGSIDPQSGLFLGLLAAGLLATVGYQFGRYRRFRYAVDDDTVDVASGVLSRRRREIPLRRVQNVDVGQNPIQRALGIAAVRIETAGGGDTEAVLEYVGRAEADRLRDELRGRASGSAEPAEAETDTDAESDRATGRDGEEVFALSRRSLVVLSLFSFDAGAGAVSSVVGTLLSGGDPSNLVGVGRLLDDVPLSPVETAVIGVVAVAVLAWLLSVALTFARYYGFRLRRVEEGLEYERGLLQRASGTIPVEKVQTVSLRENLPHRRLGYAGIAVETAGYSPGSDRSARQLAVPLAPRAEALRVARSVEPFQEDDLDLRRPPERARRRYAVRFSLAVLVLTGVAAGVLSLLAGAGVGPGLAVDRRLLVIPAVALLLTPLAAHLRWRSRGHRAAEEYFVARTGFWRRITRVVPYYRVQTVVDTRTVFQRRRRLGSVVADTASSASLLGGDAVAIDVDADVADDLRRRLRSELGRAINDRAGWAGGGATGADASGDTGGDARPDAGRETGPDVDADEDGDDGDGTGTGTGEDPDPRADG